MEQHDRILWLIRHAKTEGHFEKPDFQRELTKRGRRNCDTVGDFLRESPDRPSVYITSPALRALETAQRLMDCAGGELIEEEAIYGAHVGTIEEIVRSANSSWYSLAIVGHNPTISQSVEMFANCPSVNLPTLGIAKIRVDDDWFNFQRGELVATYKP